MLSLISFTAMRTIGTQSVGDLPVPDIAAQSAVGGSSTNASDTGAKPAPPPEPRVEDVPPAVVGRAGRRARSSSCSSPRRARPTTQATARHFCALSQLGGDVRDLPRRHLRRRPLRRDRRAARRHAGAVDRDRAAGPAGGAPDRGLRRVAVPAAARQGPAAVSDDRAHLRPVPAPGTVNEAVAREPAPDEPHTGLIPPTQARRWRALHLRRDHRARLRPRRARAGRGRGGEVRRADAGGDPRRRRRPDLRAARPRDRRALRPRLRRPVDLQDRPRRAQPRERAGRQALQRRADRLRRVRQAPARRDGRPVERARARRPEADDRPSDHARGRGARTTSRP